MIKLNQQNGQAIIPQYCRASTLFPVIAYAPDECCFLMTDRSLGFGFVCQPLCGGANEQMQERVNSFLGQEYPDNTVLQFMLFRSPDVQQLLTKMQDLRHHINDPLTGPILQQRLQFLQQATRERLVTTTRKGTFDNGLVNDLQLIITGKVPLASQQPSERELAQLVILRSKVEASLHTLELAPQSLTAQRYLRLMHSLLNWGDNAAWRHQADDWQTDKALYQQLLDPDVAIDISDRGLKLGQQHVKILSAKKLPSQFFFGDALSYITNFRGGELPIGENYLITVNLLFPDAESLKVGIERRRAFAVNQAYGPLLKFVPILADKKQGFDVLYDSMNQGFKPIKLSYSLVLFAPSEQRVEAAAMSAINFWKERKFHLMEDRFVTLPLLLNSLPLCSEPKAINDLFRYKTLTTQQAAVLLPLFGEWKGTGTFHVALTSRNGQLMSLSLHDSDTNKNAVIAAEAGSGKSFLTNELILSYLSEGAQIWVIDAGRSYKQLCEVIGGDFIHFAEDNAICLNPFERIVNYEEDEDAIVSLVSSMASAKGLLNEWQLASLRKIMGQLWQEQGSQLTVDAIAERCLASSDRRLRDVGTQLHVFTSAGSYGHYFSQSNSIHFNNRLTVLELDELQGRKQLRQVILLQLIYQIQQEVYLGERDRKKIVIIDEAWDLLREGEVATFIEHAYRKFRKYGGSVIIATQSVNDLYENTVGRAVAENSANLYLLGQTPEAIESVKNSGRLTLSEGGFELLRSVHTLPGVYSEIFIKARHGVGVGRLIVGDFQKLLYSTDPNDVHAINTLIKQGLTLPQAIQTLIVQRQQPGML
ncbi:MAG: type IV secretion system protein TraC [Candidatus Symbiodolus clandestinus]